MEVAESRRVSRFLHSVRGILGPVWSLGRYNPWIPFVGFSPPYTPCNRLPGREMVPTRYPADKAVMTEHIKKKLEDDIQTLEHELNHELPKELKKAVAMGDLSENAEYHMAKQRQEFVRARLGQLKKRMAELSLVNFANIPKDKSAFGSKVTVYDSTKEEKIEYKLVTSEESDVTKGLISTTSPIGRALMGKKEGDTAVVVTPNGKRELEVLKLTTIHDEA